MKRICVILLLVLLLPGLLLGAGAALPEYYGESYYAELPAMVEKLKTTQGPKIVLVGGSNVAFGVDSALMEDLLSQAGESYTVCNFGLYAAVGTSAMLSLSEKYLNAGDRVVLAIEPTSETFSTYFGATAFWKCAESSPELLLNVNSSQKSALVGNYLAYLQERVEIFRSGILPQPADSYAKASFDDSCNMIYDRAGNVMALGYDTGNPIDLDDMTISADFAEQVNGYCRRLKAKGVAVYLSFSPMDRGAMVSADADTMQAFFDLCNRTFDCPVISDPNRYVLDSGWFYDTNFHLNTPGARLRTYRLTEDLLNQLGSYVPLDFETPEMPASIYATPDETGDSADFVLEEVGENGCRVAGLTAAGAAKQVLTVPSVWQGRSVVAICETAFAGNTRVTEIILPESVESIPDRAFAGCTALKKLTLLHTTTTPTVGDGLLTGTENVKICVPSSAYPLYRDGAGCASNPWEQYLDKIVTY